MAKFIGSDLIANGPDPITGAVPSETIEEAGWRPTALRPLVAYHPSNGLSDQRFHTFLATGADRVGEPSDPGESERVAWVQPDELALITERGEMKDGLSLTAVLYASVFAGLR